MMKIMYVEDNPANISLLQRIARMGGHEVINYTDGEKALERFADDNPDLVLMDLQLEGRIGGLDVVKKLRERGFTTPIVAVTAYAMVGDRERCIEAGCDSYLSKPLPVAELVELVQTYERKASDQPSQAPAEAPAVTISAETPAEAPAEAPAVPVVDTQEVDVLKVAAETPPDEAKAEAPAAPAAVAETATPTENA